MIGKGLRVQGSKHTQANRPSWCGRDCSGYCGWCELRLRKEHSWKDIAQENLDREDLHAGSIFVAEGHKGCQYHIGVIPQNDTWRAMHLCETIGIEKIWYLPPMAGSQRVVDIVHRIFAGNGDAFVMTDAGCGGSYCIWLNDTEEEVFERVQRLVIWMLRKPYDLQTGVLLDSWKEDIDQHDDSEPDYDLFLTKPVLSFTSMISPFIRDAKSFSKARRRRLKVAKTAVGSKGVQTSPVESIESVQDSSCASRSEPEYTTKTTLATVNEDDGEDGVNNEGSDEAKGDGNFNSFAQSDPVEPSRTSETDKLTPPPSPNRLSFKLDDLLHNAEVDFRWLGEGRGTMCNISVHIPSGGDLPSWLKERSQTI